MIIAREAGSDVMRTERVCDLWQSSQGY